MDAGAVPPITTEELNEGIEKVLAAGAPFAVMPMTVRGVDYPRVFALSNMSLRDVLALKTAENKDLPFIVYEDERYTVGEVWARSMRFANWLKAQGIGQGDRVAIAMRNYPEWCVAYLGIVCSGATVVPLNAWWQADELRYGLTKSEAKMVVADAKRAEIMLPCKDELGLTFIAGREDIPGQDEKLHAILADDAISMDVPQDPIDPDSDYCLLFTSGSTGKPKGALLTHRGVLNAVLSWSFTLEVFKLVRPEVDLSPENPGILLSLPLFHVTGLHSIFLLGYLSGRKLVFTYRWDPKQAAKIIRDEKLTHFLGVPTMAYDLVKAAEPGDLDTIVDIGTGGAKRPEAQVALQREMFPEISASSGYGLTETNALGTHIALGDYVKYPSSTGRPVPPVTEIAAFSPEGQRLPDGEEGEICIKSPANMRGYLDNPEATAAAFFPEGWFRTGDVGFVNEAGFVTITDRLKDMIIRGGENVSCLEVENAIHEIAGVDEVAVFGVPHEKLGEVVGAAIYGSDDLDLESVQEHAKERLAPFKVPTRIWRSPTMLPRGATGKIDKKVIRQVTSENPPHFQRGDD
ncbi:class I adenylate-forming enzyme family protein [Parvularcula lutaonensis]|uniref:Class I adenylate-forming enzyme family protein n=1 Tax=Parvularcula lutaonensis TaxID=491923 RepID=A0ABV7MFB9_9PROT|nr:class I adenylate-forming enzyme family protein [Parvularcula lutaonensis]GGY53394.1 fatty acid--CoA ligase [Parvularcula lutaonensis]